MKSTSQAYFQATMRKLLDSLPSEVDSYYIEYVENEQLEKRINHLIQKKDFKTAMSLAQTEVDKHPFSLESRLLIAKLYYAVGQYEDSLQLLDQAETYHPSDLDILRLKASNYLSLKLFDLALEAFKKLLPVSDSFDSDLFWEVGLCYQAKSQTNTAITYFLKALEKDPTQSKSLNSLLEAAIGIGEMKVAIHHLKQYTDEKPLVAYHWYNYSAALLADFYYEQAEECLRDALCIKPDEAQFISALGNLLCYKGKAQEALELYSRLETQGKCSSFLLCLKALCFEMLGKPKEALSHYQKATVVNPEFAWGWFGYGKLLNSFKKHFEAIFFLKKAIVLNPSVSQYWFALGMAERDAENYVSAQEAFLQATYLEEDSPEPWLELAYTYYMLEMRDQALETIINGLEVIPNSSELNYLAGAYLYLKGRVKEGSVYMQTAASIDIDSHVVLFQYFPELEFRLAFLKAILGVNTI